MKKINMLTSREDRMGTALRGVVYHTEKAYKEISLEIDGASNNVKSETPIQFLGQFDVKRGLINWVYNMIKNLLSILSSLLLVTNIKSPEDPNQGSSRSRLIYR